MLSAITDKDFEYEKVEQYVDKHFDYIDSHASDRVIDWILLGNIPEDIQKKLRHIEKVNQRLPLLNFSALEEEERS